MEIIEFNNNQYYDANMLQALDKTYKTKYFYGCSKSTRVVIDKYNINSNNYIFVSKTKSSVNLTLSNIEYKKAKLLLSCLWVQEYFPKLITNNDTDNNNDIDNNNNDNDSEIIIQPNILELNDNEKFKDNNGNIFEVEVRGERNIKDCYFKAKDIGMAFGIINLNHTIITSEYKQNIHYKCFNRLISDTVGTTDRIREQPNKQVLFLTYKGTCKVLFSSRTGNAEAFQDWATDKLFTIQMGTQSNKDELASSLIGVSSKTIKDVFRTNVDKTPCVYLYSIGNANKLLKSDKYGNNDIIMKYGYTDDLPRRNDEHTKLFKKELDSDIELYCFSITEAQYLSNAEIQIKDYFASDKLTYKSYDELIVLNKSRLPQVKQMYKMIQQSYIGRFSELNKQIEDYKLQIEKYKSDKIIDNSNHKNELLTEKLNSQTEINELKMKLLTESKDNEILKLQMKLINNKI